MGTARKKKPAFQFYPGDWRRDAALQSCSLGARGLWIEMICLMHEGVPYGHLKVGNKVILPPNLAFMVGANLPEVSSCLSELQEAGVLHVSKTGTMYSKRMVSDEKLRQVRAAGGVKGGNPALSKSSNKDNLTPNHTPNHVYARAADADAVSSKRDVEDVFTYWKEKTKKGAATKLSRERAAKIRTRLQTFSVEQLRQAIDGALLSDFHTSKPEYMDLVSLFRNDERVEQHIERSAGKKQKNRPRHETDPLYADPKTLRAS